MLLSVESVERAFGGVRAVDGASFGVGAGEVHGLIGPNGAGKTTLLNLVSGLLRPSGGRIRLREHRLDGKAPHRVAALGVTRTYQNIRLFGGLSALENVLVGEHLVRRAPTWKRLVMLPSARAEESAAREKAMKLLARVGLSERSHDKVAALSYGEQRRVEIARALASSPRLEALIRQVAREGQSVLLVEHNVRLVMEVSDRITVLNFGKVIADGEPKEVAQHPAVVAAYLGNET